MRNLTNPEAFQFEAATVLAAAYSAFPMNFGWQHDPNNEYYPTKTGQDRLQIQFETIRWLVDNDYLNDELGFVGGEWKGLKLTERGLNVLNSVPQILHGKEPLGKQLMVAVGKGSWEAIKILVPIAIQKAFWCMTETPNDCPSFPFTRHLRCPPVSGGGAWRSAFKI